MAAPSGFRWQERKNGEVAISHHGRHATVLRGAKAVDFLADVADLDDAGQQERMARVTGNYRRGNERQARNHPRNRHRN